MTETQITTGRKEYVPGATTCLAEAFKTDPTINYLLSSITSKDQDDYRPKFFHVLLYAAVLNGGIINEISDFAGCGVLIPSSKPVSTFKGWIQAGFIGVLYNVGLVGTKRMLYELTSSTNAAKKMVLKKGERHYYVFFLGTDEEARGKGYCSRIVRSYQDKAREEGVPIWMEAATEYCKGLYERLGFHIVKELVLGRGKCDKNGKTSLDGEGFRIWGMIWWPEEYENTRNKQ